MKKIVLGVTGASGMPYAIKFLDEAKKLNFELTVIFTEAGCLVLNDETDKTYETLEQDYPDFKFLLASNLMEELASGTNRVDAVVVCPCSMKTLGALAAGISANLLERVCDVALKEGFPLILVPRETPFNLIHLKNMARLAEAGAIILPACPAFYHQPKTIDDITGFVVSKIFTRLGIKTNLLPSWKPCKK